MSAILFVPEASQYKLVPYPRTLEKLQQYVGGYVQMLPTKRNTYPFAVYADEEGMLKWDASRNFNAMSTIGNLLHHVPVGNVIVVKESDDGLLVGATEDEICAFLERACKEQM